MTDALRTDRSSSSRDAADRERDARVEELLLTGLDHYFAGRYELAINVWTRVLFLDRGHARARAYIERARSAVAERQREADELLEGGAAALKRGDRETARRLLTAVVERGASGEDALALLHRLERLDVASGAVPARAPAPPPAAEAGPAAVPTGRDPRLVWLAGGLVGGILLAAVAAGYLWIVSEPIAFGTAPLVAADPLPVPSPAEIRLYRARALAASGRVDEALALLAAGQVDDRHRAAFDELRATIQRQLLGRPQGPDHPAALRARPGAPASTTPR